jgi:hypothetical protein
MLMSKRHFNEDVEPPELGRDLFDASIDRIGNSLVQSYGEASHAGRGRGEGGQLRQAAEVTYTALAAIPQCDMRENRFPLMLNTLRVREERKNGC